MIAKTIGKRIHEKRKALGLTQEEAAKICKLSTRAFATLERGKANSTIATLEKICQGLEMDVESLFLE